MNLNNKKTVHDLMQEVEKRRKTGTGIALSTGTMVAVFEYIKELEKVIDSACDKVIADITGG